MQPTAQPMKPRSQAHAHTDDSNMYTQPEFLRGYRKAYLSSIGYFALLNSLIPRYPAQT